MKTRQEIIENLLDAGCEECMIQQFLRCFNEGNLKQGMKVIDAQRKQLLSAIHEGQRKIDCLDYLVYEMSKAEPGARRKVCNTEK